MKINTFNAEYESDEPGQAYVLAREGLAQVPFEVDSSTMSLTNYQKDGETVWIVTVTATGKEF